MTPLDLLEAFSAGDAGTRVTLDTSCYPPPAIAHALQSATSSAAILAEEEASSRIVLQARDPRTARTAIGTLLNSLLAASLDPR